MSFIWNTKRMGWNVANEQTTHTTHMQTNTHTHTEKSNFRKDSSLLVIPPPPLFNKPPSPFYGKNLFYEDLFYKEGGCPIMYSQGKAVFYSIQSTRIYWNKSLILLTWGSEFSS